MCIAQIVSQPQREWGICHAVSCSLLVSCSASFSIPASVFQNVLFMLCKLLLQQQHAKALIHKGEALPFFIPCLLRSHDLAAVLTEVHRPAQVNVADMHLLFEAVKKGAGHPARGVLRYLGPVLTALHAGGIVVSSQNPLLVLPALHTPTRYARRS